MSDEIFQTAMTDTLRQQLGRVGVLYGGESAEREISLKTGAAVMAALDELRVDHTGIDVGRNAIADIQNAGLDRAFIALHGPGGEDGRIQAVLEYLRIPYTGSDVQSSALAMDKLRSKQVWKGVGLSTPDFISISETTDFEQVLEELGGEAIVKPAHEGSSLGMARVQTVAELNRAYEKAADYDGSVLLERLVNGPEYTVAVLSGKALPPIRLETDHKFYDFDAKYVADDTRYLCPCGLSVEREDALKELALKAFDSLGCRGWGRVDVMADEEGRFYLLEVNTVPGMTGHSLVPMAAQAEGLTFNDLVRVILQESLHAS